MKELGIYVHIPFCVKKCRYCDFYSLACYPKIRDYVSAICSHIAKESKENKDRDIDTVYFGGGTPSLLETEEIKQILKALKDNFNFAKNCEMTLEMNPGTVTKEKLVAYKEMGINRLSIGLQSTNDEELKVLGRIHDFETFKENFHLARECGFDNISVDIMYALPNQKEKDFLKTVEEVCDFSPEHISAYCLKIESGTEFYKIKDTLEIPSEDEQYSMYVSACELLKKNGYRQYEISNFSKENRYSRHNLRYWLQDEYIGFGPGAHSFVNGERYFYEKSVDAYVKTLKCGKMPEKIYENEHSMTENEKQDEYVMLRMRLSCGVDGKDFEKKFSKEFSVCYPKIEKYVKSGHVVKEDGKYHFTESGFFVSNFILSDILEFI